MVNPVKLVNKFILQIIYHSLFSLIVFLFVFQFISCTSQQAVKFYGSKYYESDYSLTENTAYSYSTDLILRIPEGWFTAEDNECNCIDLWLIRDDFSASLNLMRLNVDPAAALKIEAADLVKIVDLSKKLKKEKLGDKFVQTKEDEFFEMNLLFFSAYEYQGDEGLPVRIVVFKYKNRFFEFSALPSREVGQGEIDLQELFRIQQSVLSSIR